MNGTILCSCGWHLSLSGDFSRIGSMAGGITMLIEKWIELGSIIIAIAALVIRRHGMKKYLPVGLFAHIYADYVCVAAMKGFDWWSFPERLYPGIAISISANKIAIPVLAMFWVRYLPSRRLWQIAWWLGWSVSLSVAEFFANRYTRLIAYHNGYEWYYTLLFWLITWPIWYCFHAWLTRNHSKGTSIRRYR